MGCGGGGLMTQTVTLLLATEFISNGGTVTTTVDAPANSMVLVIVGCAADGLHSLSISDSASHTWTINPIPPVLGSFILTATTMAASFPMGTVVTVNVGAGVSLFVTVAAMTGVDALDTTTVATPTVVSAIEAPVDITVTSDTLSSTNEIVMQYSIGTFIFYDSIPATELYSGGTFSSSYDIVSGSTAPVSFITGVHGEFDAGQFNGFTETYFMASPSSRGNFLIMFR